VINATVIRAVLVATAVIAAGIDWHGVAAVAAAAIVVAGIDRHSVAAIVAVGVNRGYVAVAHRLAARERNCEPRDGHAEENPIVKHGRLLASEIATVHMRPGHPPINLSGAGRHEQLWSSG
jgi:hypothetical protein